MATMVKSLGTEGLEGYAVEIEVTTLKGQLQSLIIIGMGDQAIKEAGERIQAALKDNGYDFPKDKVIISLAPGDRKKRGTQYDLPMVIALLQETAQIAARNLEHYAFIGELSLSGALRSCRGILSMVTEAKKLKIPAVIVPYASIHEAKAVPGIKVYGFKKLHEVVTFLETGKMPNYPSSEDRGTAKEKTELDFKEVKGQSELIGAIMLAAAGGHNLLMIGEPGCGKTMIAQRIPTILPKMTEAESLEVTKIHSIAGLLKDADELIQQRPFRAPHHNVSLNALIGGGVYAQPGEVSLAHNGVLFLDELPEFTKSSLDALRQPLENRYVTICRVNGTNTFPAGFMFVAAMNPCPCGYYPGPRCKCTDYEIIHYRSKISGPIMERIDIQKDVRSVDFFELQDAEPGISSAELREKVKCARDIQNERFKDSDKIHCNAQMTVAMIQKYCELDDACTNILRDASERYRYSARVIHKILCLARTAADMDGSEKIRKQDIITALGCRDLDRSNSKMYVVGHNDSMYGSKIRKFGRR